MTPTPRLQANSAAQAGALVRRSVILQKRLPRTTACLLLSPLFFCALVFGLQLLLDSLWLSQPENRVRSRTTAVTAYLSGICGISRNQWHLRRINSCVCVCPVLHEGYTVCVCTLMGWMQLWLYIYMYIYTLPFPDVAVAIRTCCHPQLALLS